MTDDTVTPVDISDNLDDFANDFYEVPKTEPVKEEAEAEEVAEIEDDTLAPVVDDEPVEDEPEEVVEDEEEEEPEEEPKPKAKKTAKDRIEELVAKNREAERREAELIRRLEALEAPKEEKPEVKDIRPHLPADAPDPDALKEDGEPVYPLGEFDPQFIRDLTKFTIAEETRAMKEEQARQAEAEKTEAARQEIEDTWAQNLAKAEEEIPEIRESISTLVESFENLEESYGDYLASTIMLSEYGPQIMHYLSQNIGEAQKIVASGPAAATLALGRLEARFIKTAEPEQKRNKVVSKAGEPPKNTRGNAGKFTVAPDTDNLDAFEKEFFK